MIHFNASYCDAIHYIVMQYIAPNMKMNHINIAITMDHIIEAFTNVHIAANIREITPLNIQNHIAHTDPQTNYLSGADNHVIFRALSHDQIQKICNPSIIIRAAIEIIDSPDLESLNLYNSIPRELILRNCAKLKYVTSYQPQNNISITKCTQYIGAISATNIAEIDLDMVISAPINAPYIHLICANNSAPHILLSSIFARAIILHLDFAAAAISQISQISQSINWINDTSIAFLAITSKTIDDILKCNLAGALRRRLYTILYIIDATSPPTNAEIRTLIGNNVDGYIITQIKNTIHIAQFTYGAEIIFGYTYTSYVKYDNKCIDMNMLIELYNKFAAL
jgi:hypothetical protein